MYLCIWCKININLFLKYYFIIEFVFILYWKRYEICKNKEDEELNCVYYIYNEMKIVW